MLQKNGVQSMLQENGIIFKIDEQQDGFPEIISEDTFIELLEMQEDTLPNDINDQGYEDDDLDEDGLVFG